jgi:hypothetical protein
VEGKVKSLVFPIDQKSKVLTKLHFRVTNTMFWRTFEQAEGAGLKNLKLREAIIPHHRDR